MEGFLLFGQGGHGAQTTASGAMQMQSAPSELVRMAAELESLLGQFKYGTPKNNPINSLGWSEGLCKAA